MLDYKDYGILLQIIKYCNRIMSKIDNISFDSFNEDDDLKEIVCFNLLQIGELAKNFSDNFINKYSLMPWKQIKGMRDKVAHGYGTLDLDLIYNTAIKDIPELLKYCEEIISYKDKN